MKLSRLLLVALTLLNINFLSAQVELYTPGARDVKQGDRVQVDLTVAEFNKIVGLQFTLNWDSTVVDFVEVTNLNTTLDLDPNSLGVSRTGEGLLAFAWFDGSISGVTLEDSTTVFSVLYEVIGQPGDSTLIDFTDDIAKIEVLDSMTNEAPVVLFPGVISLEAPSSTTNFSQNILSLQQNYPNPFRESSTISANFAEATQATLHIFNGNGQTIYTHKQRYSAGNHSIFIDHKIFPESGIYWYQLQTDGQSVSRSMMHIK
ncbi:MAG: T9SS type A sorting domain-containing protein [Bacteroidota bacterium]